MIQFVRELEVMHELLLLCPCIYRIYRVHVCACLRLRMCGTGLT